MRKELEEIAIIDAYLDGTLDSLESERIESLIQADSQYALKIENHKLYRKAIKRAAMREEIRLAQKTKFWNWGLGIIAFLLALSLIFLVSNENNEAYSDVLKEKTENTPEQYKLDVTDENIKEENRQPKLNSVSANIKTDSISSNAFKNVNNLGFERLDKEYKNKGVVRSVDFSGYEPSEQVFLINNTLDSIITCTSGLKIYVPANCFSHEDNSKINGEIEFRIREYYSVQELLAGNLSTQSDSLILESAGMFLLSATNKGENLKLKEHSELIFQTPKAYNDSMKIYYGERDEKGTLNWKVDSVSRDPYPIMACKRGRFCEITRSFFERNYRFDKKEMLKCSGQSLDLVASFDGDGSLIGSSSCVKEEIPFKRMSCERFNYLASIFKDSIPRVFNNRWSVDFAFRIIEYYDYEAYLDTLASNGNQLARAEINKKIDENINTIFKPETRLRKFRRNRQRNFYVSNLGYVNIDKTINIPSFQRNIQLAVTTKNNINRIIMSGEKRRVFIDARQSSFNSSYFFSFLPSNERVDVFYTYYKNQKYYLLHKEIVTGKVAELSESDFIKYEYGTIQGLINKLAEFKWNLE